MCVQGENSYNLDKYDIFTRDNIYKSILLLQNKIKFHYKNGKTCTCEHTIFLQNT